MFRRRDETIPPTPKSPTPERVNSILGNGITVNGNLGGGGGVRIEGSFDGDIKLNGMLVIGETGRVTSKNIQANVVIVAGAVRGDITAEKVEIRASGRVWGNVTAEAFATEEGAFLRGQITMEEQVKLEDDAPESEESPVDNEDKASLQP